MNDREDADAASVHELVAPDDAPRLDVLIASQLDMSRNQAATLIANGRVTVDGRRERASYKARSGERIVVAVPPARSRAVVAEDIPLVAAYEDAYERVDGRWLLATRTQRVVFADPADTGWLRTENR